MGPINRDSSAGIGQDLHNGGGGGRLLLLWTQVSVQVRDSDQEATTQAGPAMLRICHTPLKPLLSTQQVSPHSPCVTFRFAWVVYYGGMSSHPLLPSPSNTTLGLLQYCPCALPVHCVCLVNIKALASVNYHPLCPGCLPTPDHYTRLFSVHPNATISVILLLLRAPSP